MNATDPAQVAIRPATAGDADSVRQLFAEHLASLGCAPDPELDADMANVLAGYRGTGNGFLLATTGTDEPVGMGGLLDGEVRRMYVRPAQRGKGVARALLRELLKLGTAAGGREFRAVIAGTNDDARHAFQSCGFLATDIAPDHPKMRHCEVLRLSCATDPAKPVVVVSGGSRGLGRHLVGHLAARCNVVFGRRQSEKDARELATSLHARGHWACPVRCDVRGWHQVEHLAQLVQTIAGPCQALIHTTGTFSLQPLADMTPEIWRDELDSTVTAGFHLWRAFAPQLTAQPRARVVFIGDAAAEQLRARRQSTAYYVGKHGLVLLARTIAKERQQSGLTCNVVSPGVLPNSIDLDQPGMKANVEFAEIAGLIDFLLSPAADAVSGSHLIASRGWNV